ncbi:hypothetical protein EV363DRAFT_1586770 [Boletus edulis]|nr:hypothetical protein EV363DRAFT_1586770 [Boletus edulis]
MPGWTSIDTHPTQGRTFRRPLDTYELGFLWDGLFNGTADNVQHFELRLSNSSQDAHLFSEANIVRAWVSTKRRYPLVGATVRGADSASLRLSVTADSKAGGGTGFVSEPHFVVQEHDLAVVRPREIIFGSVACAEEVQQRMTAIMDGPRPLSEELLVRLYVFRETASERRDILHLMILMAHCVTDGLANSTFVRCLLDTLARVGGSEPVQIPLEERLAMVIPSMDLDPLRLCSLSPSRRRWRRAVGIVIFRLRMAKRQGGHTLPCRLKRSTPYVAAKSGLVSTALTHSQTAAVVANCHLHNLTFGNAYLALAQVAMTRVLYRRYLRGDISEEEWEHRKRQPHIGGGPFNLRPYLDKAWFDKGGAGEFMLSISLFYYQLPFMTLGATAEQLGHACVLSDGAPPFPDLLTFDRFLHRAGLIKKQMTAFFSHPLFFEIVYATGLARTEHTRLGALQWMKRHVESANGRDTWNDSDDEEVLAVTDTPAILAHAGSSFGSVDLITPNEYPLPSTHPLSPYSPVSHPVKAGYVTPPSSPPSGSENEEDTIPTIVVENTRTHLHARPAELYLGAASSRGELKMYVFYDGNVFEEGVVREWLDEVKEAVLWYLGQTHGSRWNEQHRGDGAGRYEATSSKL